MLDKLNQRVHDANTLLCIGLDPHALQLSEPSASTAFSFCKKIVEETHPFAAAFKPNIAFFECLGPDGINALINLISIIPKDIPILLDAKRGDIDTTAQAYASAVYDCFSADSVTLSPYMGWDSIYPFVTGSYANKGAFILCKTSNPSSHEIQQLSCDNEPLYFKVLEQVKTWNSKLKVPTLGIVAGATDCIALKALRSRAKDIWILCPGVGAQGGEVEKVCDVALRDDGSGLLVSVSRAISKATDMADAALKLRDEINVLRESHVRKIQSNAAIASVETIQEYKKEFLKLALQSGALQFGSFVLKSGRISPYFFNAGRFCEGDTLHRLARCFARAIKDSGIEFDVIFGPAYKGIPLAAIVGCSWYDLYRESKGVSYSRKEVKDHGEGGMIVGALLNDKRVLVIDDVITAGTALREAVSLLQSANATIAAAVVSIDRQERASDSSKESAVQQVFNEYGFPVLSIARLSDLLSFLSDTDTEGDYNQYLPALQSYRDQYGV